MRATLVLLILLLGQPALSYCVHAPSSASSSRHRRPLPALHATPDLNRRPANPTAACGAAVGAIPRGGGTTAAEAVPSPRARLSASLPCGDELDKKILKLSLPAVCNFLILPLTQATDLFWVGRIGDAMALAAQAAANQARDPTDRGVAPRRGLWAPRRCIPIDRDEGPAGTVRGWLTVLAPNH